jgi:outer membrane lipoprotein-sorting protein
MTRILLAMLLAGCAAAEPLETILARMDAAAKTSVSFSANVRWLEYTKVLKSTDEQTGAMKLKKSKKGVVGRMDIETPAPYVWRFGGDTWEKYLPKANIVTQYKTSKLAKAADQYLLLAFGLSGAELKKSYAIKAGGEETVNGTRATRLELVPKDQQVKQRVALLELWIPVGQTYTIQQKASEPNGDYNLYIYSDAKLNPGLPDAAFDFAVPAGARVEVMK